MLEANHQNAGSDPIVHGTDTSFAKDVIESDLPVMVDFWAPWCAPCRMMGDTLERIAPSVADRVRVVKINVDENPATAQRFGVMSIPTLIFFDKGRAVGMVTGALPEEALRQALDLHARGELESRTVS